MDKLNNADILNAVEIIFNALEKAKVPERVGFAAVVISADKIRDEGFIVQSKRLDAMTLSEKTTVH